MRLLICIVAASSQYAFAMPAFINLNIAETYKPPAHQQKLTLFNGLGNTYVANNNWQNKLSAILGFGITAWENQKLKLNAGFNYIPVIDIPQSGVIWQLHSPTFANSNYSYHLSSNFLLAEGELFIKKFIIEPSFIFGIGASLNKINNYTLQARNQLTAVTDNKFTDSSNSQLSYEFGGALNYPVKNILFSLAYRYLNAGKINLGPFNGQQTTNRLSSEQIQLHTLSLGVKLIYAKNN